MPLISLLPLVAKGPSAAEVIFLQQFDSVIAYEEVSKAILPRESSAASIATPAAWGKSALSTSQTLNLLCYGGTKTFSSISVDNFLAETVVRLTTNSNYDWTYWPIYSTGSTKFRIQHSNRVGQNVGYTTFVVGGLAIDVSTHNGVWGTDFWYIALARVNGTVKYVIAKLGAGTAAWVTVGVNSTPLNITAIKTLGRAGSNVSNIHQDSTRFSINPTIDFAEPWTLPTAALSL